MDRMERHWKAGTNKPVNYTVVSAVDSELQTWGKETKEEVIRLVEELTRNKEHEEDVLVFAGKPLPLKVETSISF